MNKELLNAEILIQCQNVQCGAKLAAEIHYIYKETESNTEDILLIDEILKYWPDLKYLISYHSDKDYRRVGWKSIYLFKYKEIKSLIDSINSAKESNPILYHFASGKLFGYNDHEVMKFIEKELQWH